MNAHPKYALSMSDHVFTCIEKVDPFFFNALGMCSRLGNVLTIPGHWEIWMNSDWLLFSSVFADKNKEKKTTVN